MFHRRHISATTRAGAAMLALLSTAALSTAAPSEPASAPPVSTTPAPSAAAQAAAPASVKQGVDAWQSGNFTGAVKIWRPIAERGDADAQFNMGQAYKLGRGVGPDLKIAQSWYEKAAQQGHQEAQANLGLILFQSGNRKAAMPWIEKASAHGDPRADYVLGTALFNGDMMGKDWPRAYALMTRAAGKGLPQAASSLTQMDKFIPLADRQKGIQLARSLDEAKAAPAPVRVAALDAKPAAAKPAKPAAKEAAKAGAKEAAKPAAKPAAKEAAKEAVSPAPGGKWRVQLGAFDSPSLAKGQWTLISRKLAAVAKLQPSYEPAGKFTRLRVGPLASRAEANRLCATAKASGQDCFVVAPAK